MVQLEVDSYENPFANATGLTWLVRFVSVQEIWRLHPTSLCHELDFYVGALLTLVHALRVGGRFPYLWLTTILHGLVLENLTFILPDVNNFWHHQGTVTLLGGRLPLHILMLYPTFIYTASAAVAKARLPTYIRPFAVGVCAVLMDMPYDIMGIKLLWWTWHDTDPNIGDRTYYVPWTSYYFHATFAASLTFFNFLLRKVIVHKHPDDAQSGSVPREVLVCVLSSFFGFSGGVLLFIPFYHPMHDVLGVHTECIVIPLLFTFALISWSADRKPTTESRSHKSIKPDVLVLLVIFHYALYVLLVIFAEPEKSVVVGLHEKIGPCNETTLIRTPFGQVLKRRKYFCATDYDEPLDFHCTKTGVAPPSEGHYWYTICGTPYGNHSEYIFVVSCVCALASFVYFQLLLRSSSDILAKVEIKYKKPKMKQN